MSNVVYVQIVKISNWSMDMCIRSIWIVIKLLLITWSKYSEVCFNLAMFCDISLLFGNVITFKPMTYLTYLESLYDRLDWINDDDYYYYDDSGGGGGGGGDDDDDDDDDNNNNNNLFNVLVQSCIYNFFQNDRKWCK